MSGVVTIASHCVLGVLLDHGRQPFEVVDGRRGRVDVGHPGRVERRALAREREQRPEAFGPVALDSLARPLKPRNVVLERSAYRVQMGHAQMLVGRLRVLERHALSLPCRIGISMNPLRVRNWVTIEVAACHT